MTEDEQEVARERFEEIQAIYSLLTEAYNLADNITDDNIGRIQRQQAIGKALVGIGRAVLLRSWQNLPPDSRGSCPQTGKLHDDIPMLRITAYRRRYRRRSLSMLATSFLVVTAAGRTTRSH
jgi:hypothetical protein